MPQRRSAGFFSCTIVIGWRAGDFHGAVGGAAVGQDDLAADRPTRRERRAHGGVDVRSSLSALMITDAPPDRPGLVQGALHINTRCAGAGAAH